VPTEFVELPSEGMFYSKDHPLFGQSTIEIKYMTAKEEDLLASEALIKQGLVIERLLKSIMVDPDIDPKSLLVGDRNAIMVAARISAYGREYEVNTYCDLCGEIAENYVFDLEKQQYKSNFSNQLFLKEHDITFDDEAKNYIIKLPKSGLSVGIKLITGHDSGSLDDIDKDSIVTELLAKFVVSVENISDPPTVNSFVHHMPASDSRFLRNIYLELMPNVDLAQDFVCPACKTVQNKEVLLDAGFFWP